LIFNGVIEQLDIQTSHQGKLKDLTFVAKDLLDVEGRVTGGGNPDWKSTHPKALKHCPAIQALLDEGARLTGKSLTDELAFSLDGLNVHYPVPHNPNFPGCITGGSSSGSASAVANNVCDFALGTDTAGSIRVPAAYCGIYGMRPSHGRISLEGSIPLGTTFDTIGFMSRSLALLNQVGSVLLKDPQLEPQMRQISLVQDSLSILDQKWHKSFLEKWSAVSDSKIDLKNELDSFSELFNHARGFEAWQAHGEWFEQTNPNMGEAIKQRFQSCRNISEHDYRSALTKRTESIKKMHQKLNGTFLFLPTVRSTPPLVDASEDELMQNRKANILLNSLASFCGLPQITLPYRHEDKKFAFSLVGPHGSDMELLALASFIERSDILE
jgi:amidase